MNRRHLLVAAGIVTASLNLGSTGAFANNFSVSACTDGKASISVNISAYWEHKPNHIVVKVGGTTVGDTVFEDAYSHTFQTVNGATWKVDLSTSDGREEQHRSGTITCGPVVTSTNPATTVPATSTTVPSTTTPPASTTVPVTIAPAGPPTTPQAHVTPRLPATGFPFGVATGIVVFLVLVGFVLVAFSVNKREVSELHGFGERETER